jgi:hypothetical protein
VEALAGGGSALLPGTPRPKRNGWSTTWSMEIVAFACDTVTMFLETVVVGGKELPRFQFIGERAAHE